MADINQTNWSETDASNTTAAPDGMPEGMAPSGVNDWGRAVMGAVKRLFNRGIPKVTAGTTTAYTVTYTVAPAAYVDGETYLVRFNATNGTAPTININALGATPLYRYSGGAWAAVASGDITANMVCRLSYNSSEGSFRVVSSSETAIGAAFKAIAGTFSALQTFSAGITMSASAFNEAVRVDVASATTTNIGAAAGNYVRITGTTTITAFDTVASGIARTVVFAGILTLTHDATALILEGGANITTAAGDTAIFRSEGSGNWRCIKYQKATGKAVVETTYTGVVRAWANWAGTTATINASGNVNTPIVRNGTGDYSLTLTAAAPANAVFLPSYLDASATGGIKVIAQSTTVIRVLSHDVAGSPIDFTTYSLTVIA